MDTQEKITSVRVEGLVLLKIIKHCQDEQLSSQDCVNGILLGLARGSELQITTCFPLPKVSEDDASNHEQLSAYESDMIKKLRDVNSDYLNIGLYQTGCGGLLVNRAILENIHQYQSIISEAVLLTYDPTRASRGQIGLKAYRLSEAILKAMSDSEMRAPGNLKEAAANSGRTNFTRLLDEIPVYVHNSRLVNLVLNDIDESKNGCRRVTRAAPTITMAPALSTNETLSKFTGLDLSMASSLEQQLRSVLSGLETIHDYQYTYQRISQKYSAVGQAKTTIEQRNREMAQVRLDTSLISAQLNLYCSGLSQMAGQTVGKLLLTQAVHQPRILIPNKFRDNQSNN